MGDQDLVLREFLVKLLDGATHMPFEEAVENYPLEFINSFPLEVKYSVWQLLEHIRFTQKDILDFITNPHYKEPKWPEDYWPDMNQMADKDIWEQTITSFLADKVKLQELVMDKKRNLTEKIPWGDGQTFAEEIIKAADHSSYHIGEFAILRQVMGTWPKGH